MSEIETRVIKVVAEHMDIDLSEIKLDASFTDDLGADSLDLVEIVMALEEEFDIEIPDENAENITTVKDAIEFITKKTKEAA